MGVLCSLVSASGFVGFDPDVTDSATQPRRWTPTRAHRMPPKKKPPPAGAPLKPQGSGGRKRTPTSAFDAAAGKDKYEPEKVIAEPAAGNMHGDLQKSAKDSTLEHSLFAAFNTD